jgi:hypothetical protein
VLYFSISYCPSLVKVVNCMLIAHYHQSTAHKETNQ